MWKLVQSIFIICWNFYFIAYHFIQHKNIVSKGCLHKRGLRNWKGFFYSIGSFTSKVLFKYDIIFYYLYIKPFLRLRNGWINIIFVIKTWGSIFCVLFLQTTQQLHILVPALQKQMSQDSIIKFDLMSRRSSALKSMNG